MAEYKAHPPVHPGELLREEFLEPMGITAYELAKGIGVPAPRVYDIVREKRGISADTALRLSRYFEMSERYWINAQAHYDLQVTSDKAREQIERQVVPRGRGWFTNPKVRKARQRIKKNFNENQDRLDRQGEWIAAGKWAEYFVSGEAEADFASRVRVTSIPPRVEGIAFHRYIGDTLCLPEPATNEERSIMRMKLEESDDPKKTLEIAQQAMGTARKVIEDLLNKQTSFEAIPNHYYDVPATRQRIEVLRGALQQHREEAVVVAQELSEIHAIAARRLNNQVMDMRGEVDRLFTLLS